MRIHLKGDIWIDGDDHYMQIVRITKCKSKNGNEYERKTELSGYCTDFEHLFKSFKRKSTLASGLEGEFADLIKLEKKIDRDIKELVKIAKLEMDVDVGGEK